MYAYPPFSLIHICLQKVIEDRAQVLLVAPLWRSRPWYLILLDLLTDQPCLLPMDPLLVHLPWGSLPHPLLSHHNFRLDSIRQSLFSQNIPERVSKILLASWKERTEKQYESAWKQFCRWCHKKLVNLFSCYLDSILLYLSDLYEKGLQYRTINSHRSTISMTHLPIDNVCVGAHPLVSRLMKGIFNLRPAVPKYLKTWDVSVVLKYLISLSPAPFLLLKN